MMYVTTRQLATRRRQYEVGDLVDLANLRDDEIADAVRTGGIVPTRFAGTAAELAGRNPIPGPGIPAVETDTGVVKFGDGVTAYNSLPSVAQRVAADAALTGTFASVVSLTGTGIDTSGATDSTTAINALLAASGGKVVRGVPGSTYRISAPLVVRSGTILGMRACVIKLAPGSVCNMLNNTAVTAARSVMDAAITSGAATLTSATAAFTAGDVGVAVTIRNAGSSGVGSNAVDLVTTIQSVTNGTTAVLAANAGATVTSAAASIGPRDTNITVIGGTWDYQQAVNVATGVNAHGLRFRRVDGLTLRDIKMLNVKKYSIAPGDVTDLYAENLTGTGPSNLIQINGPARGVRINKVGGNFNDDICALTSSDYTAYMDVAGDITDVNITGIYSTNSMCGFKLIGGTGTKVRGVDVDGIYGTTYEAAVRVIDDQAGSTDVAGLRIRNVRATQGSTFNLIELACSAGKDISIDGITYSGAANRAAVDCYTNGSTFSLAKLDIRNVYIAPASAGAYILNHEYGSITNLNIDGVTYPTGVPAVSNGIIRLAGVSVTETRVSNVDGNFTGGFFIIGLGNSCTLDRLALLNIKLIGAGNGTVVATGSGVTHIDATGLYVTGLARVILAQSACDIRMAASTVDVTTQIVRATAASGAVRLEVCSVNNVQGVAAITHDSTAPISLTGLGKGDLAILTPVDGDLITNTNAGQACGTGPVIYNSVAAHWKHLYTGLTSL